MSATFAYWYQWHLQPKRENALGSSLENESAMNSFLAEVERKAFVIARMSLQHEADALDVVQDAMIRLVRKYSTRPRDEWKPLFYRILKNRIVDFQRSRMVRQKVMAWLPGSSDKDAGYDPVAEAPGHPGEQPQRQVEANETLENLQAAVNELPARQQQAFLLRTAEGLDVAQTATAMGCSTGSVKTHYSRAVHSLRATLGDEA